MGELLCKKAHMLRLAHVALVVMRDGWIEKEISAKLLRG